ncbi:MAG: UDP-N-acetylmuramoyl-tripeptide--D-alanyl-D-alanine ligase [Alphaproteobacteria bacterium]
MLWSQQQLSAGLGRLCDIDGASGFVIDSRLAKKHNIFLPLKGDRVDGHQYIESAIKNGALASFCLQDKIKNYPALIQKKLLPSHDVMADIKKLALYRRDEIKKNHGKVLAITGSVGKTSVKEMVGLVLEKSHQPYYKSPANQNNTLGVPLCLLNTPHDIVAGVYEAGMNHSGELLDIGKVLRPDIVIITNIRESHIGNLGSLAAIASAKAELLCNMMPQAVAILEKNKHDDFFDMLKTTFKKHQPHGRVVSFGIEKTCDIYPISIKQDYAVQTINAKFFQKTISYHLNLVGEHYAMNSLAALAGLHFLGMDDIYQNAMIDYQPMKGRGDRHFLSIKGKNIMVIDESYNAAPSSMKKNLKTLNDTTEPRLGASPKKYCKIAILGDMKELGDDEITYHRQVIETAMDLPFITHILLLGDMMGRALQTIDVTKRKKIKLFDTIESINHWLDSQIDHGDMIMVKASRAMGLEKIIEHLQDSAKGD